MDRDEWSKQIDELGRILYGRSYFLTYLKKELPVSHEHGEGTIWYILALILGRCLRGFLL